MSYVLGTPAERERLTILDKDEINMRIKRLKESGGMFLKVTKAENKPAYDKFVADVLQSFCCSVVIKDEPE